MRTAIPLMIALAAGCTEQRESSEVEEIPRHDVAESLQIWRPFQNSQVPRHGYLAQITRDGRIVSKEIWKDGRPVDVWQLHDGQWRHNVKNGSGWRLVFDEAGNEAAAEYYRDGEYSRGFH